MYQDVADSSSPLQLIPQKLSGSLTEVNADMGNVEGVSLVKPLEYRTRRLPGDIGCLSMETILEIGFERGKAVFERALVVGSEHASLLELAQTIIVQTF